MGSPSSASPRNAPSRQIACTAMCTAHATWARASSSDRAFRALARSEPEVVVALLEALVPGLLPEGCCITPAGVDDPHADASVSLHEADWVASVEPGDMLHIECQGYGDVTFASRLFRHHLTLTLRHPARRVRTVAVWTARPAYQMTSIDVADVSVRITSLVLAATRAETLLRDSHTTCFAAGADPQGLTVRELCRRVARALAALRASPMQRTMALVVAASSGRYEEMVRAMEEMGVEPVVIEDLVRLGQHLGFEEGVRRGREEGFDEGVSRGCEQGVVSARAMLADVFELRGVELGDGDRARIEAERSLGRLRLWHRRALVAPSAIEVFAE